MKKDNCLTARLSASNTGDVIRHTELINGKSVEFSFVCMSNGWTVLSGNGVCFVPKETK